MSLRLELGEDGDSFVVMGIGGGGLFAGFSDAA